MAEAVDYGPRGFGAYMKAQWDEVLSPYNVWITTEKLGHHPSQLELFENYANSGGAERFRVKWFTLVEQIRSSWNRWFTGEKVGHDPSDGELYENFVATGAERQWHDQLDKRFL